MSYIVLVTVRFETISLPESELSGEDHSEEWGKTMTKGQVFSEYGDVFEFGGQIPGTIIHLTTDTSVSPAVAPSR